MKCYYIINSAVEKGAIKVTRAEFAAFAGIEED